MALPSTSSLNPDAPVFVPGPYQAAGNSPPKRSLNPNAMGLLKLSLNPDAPVFTPAPYQADGDSLSERSLNPNALVFVPASYGAAGRELITPSGSVSIPSVLKMEEEAACKTLLIVPDDLVERIITMLPFPAIFKARCLSQTWLARVFSSSPDEKEAQRCLVPSFHKQVMERTRTWGIEWPVFIRRGSLRGYDSTFLRWQKMPSLEFLPCDVLNRARSNWFAFHVEIQGVLLFAYVRPWKTQDMYVANILTKTWRSMAPPQDHFEKIVYQKFVIENSSQTYKVILFGTGRHQAYWFFLSYDSKSEAWTRDQFARQQLAFPFGTESRDYPNTGAYVNGVLYMVSLNHPQHLMAYNLRDRTFERSILVLDLVRDLVRDNSNWVVNVDLVADDADLLMILSLRSRTPPTFSSEFNQRVLRIDVKSGGLMLQLSQRIGGSEEHGCISDGKCITFGKKLGSRRVHQYNLHTNRWSSFYAPKDCIWFGSYFQPGLNPTMEA